MKTYNTDILSQVRSLEFILLKNTFIKNIFDNADRLELPHWYLGAGCVAQTVWNYLSEKEMSVDIIDYDLAYFDPQDLTYESEDKCVANVRALFKELPIKIDVKNQARVHLWYEDRFGHPIESYQSVEEAINTWPTTATCVGVRYIQGTFEVYAPYGLNDMFGMIVRPNKLKITEEIYNNKINRWKECWPSLQIMPW
jgi:uncharacterized protein